MEPLAKNFCHLIKSVFLILYFISWSALAGVTVEVIDTFPESTDQALAVNQNFYVHLRYASDTPVRIYVRPFTQGKASNAISHGAFLLPPVADETLGWFALRAPGVVDEFRVLVDTENSGYPKEVLSVPVKLKWKPGGIMTETGMPDWIGNINQRNEILMRAAQRNAGMGHSVGNMVLGMLIMPLLFGIPVLAFALSVVAFIRWPGAWRYAAGLPSLVFGIWVVNFIIDVTRDPTSHNLWPFELLYGAGYALAWLAVLFVARKLLAKKAAAL